MHIHIYVHVRIVYLYVHLYIYIYIYLNSPFGMTVPQLLGIFNNSLHPVRIARIRCPRFVPRVGLPRHPFC